MPGGAGCVGRLAGAWEDDAAGVDEAARAEREKGGREQLEHKEGHRDERKKETEENARRETDTREEGVRAVS